MVRLPGKRFLFVAAVLCGLCAGVWAGPAIVDVRTAHYPDENRTRVVLDCTAQPTYTPVVRSTYVVVMVLDGRIQAERDYRVEGLPERIRLEPFRRGAAVLISFRQSVQVSHFREPPNESHPHHRIVLDFRARASSQQQRPRGKCVILDPGHGGWNKGAQGRGAYSRLVEKDIVLDIARRVQALFARNDWSNSTQVFLTRSSDRLPFVSRGSTADAPSVQSQLNYRRKDLGGRVQFGEEKAAVFGRENTVFISLHVNWAPSSTAHGFEVYIANDEAVARGERRELEERENAGVQGGALDPRVAALIRSRARETSTRLARSMLSELGQLGGMTPHGENGGLRHANFVVLRTLDFPAVLAEVAYLSNVYDARRLAAESFREDVARAIYNSIVRYFKQRDPVYPLSPIEAPAYCEYTVKAGDTLSSIAGKFNTTYRSIMRANGLSSCTIYPGQVLRIPA